MSDYSAPDYQPTSAVSLFHNVPRLGHSGDLTVLAKGDMTVYDYVIGTSFIAATILVVFILWLALLCVFKFLGKKVGFLSGRRLKGEKPHWFVRTLVMVSCAFALAAGAMYLVKATTSLYDTFDSIRDSATSLSDLATEITDITNDLIDAGTLTMPIRDSVVDVIEGGVCSSFDSGNGEPIDVDTNAQKVVEVLTDLNDFTNGELIDIRENFSTQFEAIESEVNYYIDLAQEYAKTSYYAIGVICLSALLYIGAYLAWFGQGCISLKSYFCLQTWVILPLYLLSLVATAIFTSAIGTALVVNSDICTSGEGSDPESLLQVLLDEQGIAGIARESIDHYIISGCVSEFDGVDQLSDLVYTLEEGITVSSELKAIIANDIALFEMQCGGEPGSLMPVLTGLEGMKIALAAFTLIGYDAENLLACKGLNKIYRGLSHVSICSYMPETLAWMFCTMIIILFSGMTLFTLRAALLPDKAVRLVEAHDEGDYELKYMPSAETPIPLGNHPFSNCTDDDDRYEYSVGPSITSSHNDRTTDDDSLTNFSANLEDVEEMVEVKRIPSDESGSVDIMVSSRTLPVGNVSRMPMEETEKKRSTKTL